MPSDKIIGGNRITDDDPLQSSDAAVAGASGSYDANLSNTDDLTHGVCRGVYIGVTGNVKMTMEDGSVVTRNNVAAGMTHPWRARQIWSTGTTATGIVVDY